MLQQCRKNAIWSSCFVGFESVNRPLYPCNTCNKSCRFPVLPFSPCSRRHWLLLKIWKLVLISPSSASWPSCAHLPVSILIESTVDLLGFCKTLQSLAVSEIVPRLLQYSLQPLTWLFRPHACTFLELSCMVDDPFRFSSVFTSLTYVLPFS